MSDILNLKQTAEFLGYSTRTVYEMVKTGKVPAYKIGGQWRVRKSDIEHMFEPQNIERGDQ